MCHCKEPGKAGWTHEESCCYNTAAMGRLFEPSRKQALPEPFCAEPCKHVSCGTVRARLANQEESK